MLPTRQGAFRLFRIASIDVYLHWSWFVIALIEVEMRKNRYSSLAWNALEYLSLFAIVLLHEFGHALACRQVGGYADQIVLWPLGGVAYVAPPQRPGATLWSIAAGPLVNVALVPVFFGLQVLAQSQSWIYTHPDVVRWLWDISRVNLVLLAFNLLPIYPLDGGQILRSLLWFPLGRARSLLVAAAIGFLGVAGLVALAVWLRSFWIGILAAFVFMNCRQGWQEGRALSQLEADARLRPEGVPGG